MSNLKSTKPRIPREPPRQTSLDDVAPQLAKRADLILARMSEKGHPTIIAETLRTSERQEWLYGHGRSYDDGRGRVTNAKSIFDSFHGFGLAVDFWSKRDRWNFKLDYIKALSDTIREVGSLLWGGDWDNNPLTPNRWDDFPHVQWRGITPNIAPRSPSISDVQLLTQNGVLAVWRKYGAA